MNSPQHKKLPILSRPHAKLIKDYTAASKDRKNKLGRIDSYITKFRIRILKHEQARASMIRRINASLSKVQNTSEVQQLLADVEQAAKTRYNYTGILMPSSVYNGKKLPRYYRLVDPASNRTIAYVQPTDAFTTKKTPRHLGRHHRHKTKSQRHQRNGHLTQINRCTPSRNKKITQTSQPIQITKPHHINPMMRLFLG